MPVAKHLYHPTWHELAPLTEVQLRPQLLEEICELLVFI